MNDFPASFFRDEYRDGFYVPSAIKQAWAAELRVLSEIDRICQKYDISYYADWGTLLGAVRHGGFIPWDDDLDICMKRNDYIRFRQVADSELPRGFCIHDYERKEDHWLFLARVVNSEKMCFDIDHLERYNNFPWLTCVDIFILDYLYPDEADEKDRDEEISRLLSFADDFIVGKISDHEANIERARLESAYGIKLPKFNDRRAFAVAMYALVESRMSCVESDDTDRIGQLVPWIVNGDDRGFPKEYYDKPLRLSFENTTIPVPSHYAQVLRQRFGDYLTVKKEWNGHDYPFYEGQRTTMEKLAGMPVMRNEFSDDILKRSAPERKYALKEIAKRCMAELVSEQERVRGSIEDDDVDKRQILVDSQQYAASFGELIERLKGKNNETIRVIIEKLEAYCECVYQGFYAIDTESEKPAFEKMGQALDELIEVVQERILDRKEVLFLPITSDWWDSFSKYYRAEKQKDHTDVSVVPLALLKKNPYGDISHTNSDADQAASLDGYPEGIVFTDWETYNVSLLCPDRIYIQYPYDDDNPCLMLPPDFYTSELQKYTDELIYIPVNTALDFDESDERDMYTFRQCATGAASFRADRIIVPTEKTKEMYLSVISDFAGSDVADRISSRFEIAEDGSTRQNTSASSFDATASPQSTSTPSNADQPLPKKRMLYCIGANELYENTDWRRSVVERMEIFKENAEAIEVDVALWSIDEESEKGRELMQIMKQYDTSVFAVTGRATSHIEDHYTAYYGSPSPFVIRFVRAHKPVMISRIDQL